MTETISSVTNFINDNLAILLSSTVIITIITSFVTLATNRKSNHLKYITEERHTWRMEIRKIIIKLDNTTQKDSKKILNELKNYINPYGEIYENPMSDSHIWKTIQEVEKAKSDEDYTKKKDVLISYLRLLLKYDWDRSKEEVDGNSNSIALAVTAVFGILFVVYEHFIACGMPYNELFLTTLVVFIGFPILTGDGEVFLVVKNSILEKKSGFLHLLKRAFKIFYYVIIGASSSIMLVYYVFTNYGIQWEYLSNPENYCEISMACIVVFLLVFFSRKRSTTGTTSKYIAIITQKKKENIQKNTCLQEKLLERIKKHVLSIVKN